MAAATNRRQKKASDGSTKEKKERTPRESGPTLNTVIRHALENFPGPLRTDNHFAQAVFAEASRLGIGERASTFVAKASVHGPSYCSAYRLDKEGKPGRMNIQDPTPWVVAATKLRTRFLKTDDKLPLADRLTAAGADAGEVALIVAAAAPAPAPTEPAPTA